MKALLHHGPTCHPPMFLTLNERSHCPSLLQEGTCCGYPSPPRLKSQPEKGKRPTTRWHRWFFYPSSHLFFVYSYPLSGHLRRCRLSSKIIEFVGFPSIKPSFTLHLPISPWYFLNLHNYARSRHTHWAQTDSNSSSLATLDLLNWSYTTNVAPDVVINLEQSRPLPRDISLYSHPGPGYPAIEKPQADSDHL
jgi:hypothetical protein